MFVVQKIPPPLLCAPETCTEMQKKQSGLALGTTHLAQTLGVDLVSKGNSEAWEFKVVQTAAFFFRHSKPTYST